MSKARDLASAAPAPEDVDSTELGYIDGVTSAVQTQIDAKQAVVSGVNDTEIGYLDGVTSAIQTQIDSKIGQSTAINPTIVDAKGDIVAATAADTVARLAVGANDTVLTADSAEATGLKWAAPSSGGMTLLSTTSMSGSGNIGITGIDQSFTNLFIMLYNPVRASGLQDLAVRLNNNSNNYTYLKITNTAVTSFRNYTGSWLVMTHGTNASAAMNINIQNYSSATLTKAIDSHGGGNPDGTLHQAWMTGGFYESTTAITSVYFNSGGGNFTGGTILVYGVK